MRCPCHGCKERTATCHATCEKYAKWVKWKQGVNQKKYMEQMVDGERIARVVHMIKVNHKRRRR